MLTAIFEADCIVAPCIRNNPFPILDGGRHTGIYGGGIYTKNGFLNIGVQRYGNECVLNGHPDFVQPTQTIDQQIIFGGYIFDHYGHFILESTARLWAKKYFQQCKFIFTSIEKRPLAKFQYEILERFGDYEIVYNDAIQCSSLVIPSPSFVMGNPIEEEIANNYLRQMLKPNVNDIFSKKNFYLSRAHQQKRRCVNEAEFEIGLEKLDINIVYPEELSFFDQVYLFSNASLIIGTLGSAWHTLLFASPKENCTRVYLDFLDTWGDTYKQVEDITAGEMFRIKCMNLYGGKDEGFGLYNSNFEIDIDLALDEIRNLMERTDE